MIDRGDSILVRFGAHVSASEGRQSAERLVEILGLRAAHLVLDLRETRGYESEARKAWQDALWPRRHQITGLTVAVRSAVTRMGVSLFAAFLGISCRFVDDVGD